MALYGVSITKSVSFRGAAQEFANTYYYNLTVGVMTESTGLALIDAVVALEKPMHANLVSFVRGRVWSAGGTPSENTMIAQKNLSGAGTFSGTVDPTLDRERAFLVRFRAGSDTLGRPVYLRKWWHLMVGELNANGITSGQKAQTEGLTSTQRTQLVNWANNFKSVTANTFTFELRSEKQRQIDGDTVAHPYLEHHQLGDMWRG
jgi:hypothetical protein